jgi:glucokinase
LRQFLLDSKVDSSPISACFAVAGPVADNVVRFTNLSDWSIIGDELAIEFGIKKVKLINDFVAAGYGLLTLNEEKECLVLQKGVKNKNAPIACIGAGTGLGFKVHI